MPKIRGRYLSIGKAVIGSPKSSIAVSVFDDTVSDLIKKFETEKLSLRNLYEIRFDMFSRKSPEDLMEMIKDLEQLDVDYIFTYRSGSVDECQKLYELALRKLVPAADIDLNVYMKLDLKIVDSKLMLSFHNMSDNGGMIDSFKEMQRLEPDIYKLALTYNSDRDFLNDLMRLMEIKEEKRMPLAFVPMGKNSEFLRVVSSYFVSDIVYARNERETAAGQLNYEEYQNIFKFF